MADDIVTRLRRWGYTVGSLGMTRALHYEAADEIERLQAENNALQLQVVAQAIELLGPVHK